jgi:transposase
MSKKKHEASSTAGQGTLYLAFELSEQKWVLGFTIGLGQEPRKRTIAARDLPALEQEIARAQQRFGLPQTARVLSCYEAGRDGFWLHRYLVAHHIQNQVVDSASIEVNRRAKHAKTDRIDAGKLVKMLVRYDLGEPKLWSVVHVPSVEAEDARHLHRELLSLKHDHTRHTNRIKGLLAGQGVHLAVGVHFLKALDQVRLCDGSPLPPGVRARIEREYAGWVFVRQHIQALEAERATLLRSSTDPSVELVRRLLRLCAIGENSAWLFVMEFYAWRAFRNRRQIGGLAGLAATPFDSGDQTHDQGISKAGNRPIRAMAIEIAWCWLRYQPDSELTLWYRQRFGRAGKRLAKIGIVALARKLLVALWRYLEFGEVPAGAQLKPDFA